jgi:hypothetical protein
MNRNFKATFVAWHYTTSLRPSPVSFFIRDFQTFPHYYHCHITYGTRQIPSLCYLICVDTLHHQMLARTFPLWRACRFLRSGRPRGYVHSQIHHCFLTRFGMLVSFKFLSAVRLLNSRNTLAISVTVQASLHTWTDRHTLLHIQNVICAHSFFHLQFSFLLAHRKAGLPIVLHNTNTINESLQVC